MKVGMALATSDREKAKMALSRAVNELGKGREVELFLVYSGTELYSLTAKDAELGGLLKRALSKGLDMNACGACALAHGVTGKIKCKTSRYWHLFGLWYHSDKFLYYGKFVSKKGR